MKEYFYKREYVVLYLEKFFFAFANSFIGLFGTVMLYKNGMTLPMILLVYGLRFGIMGICSPLFLKISHRLGVAKCSLISRMLSIAGTSMILYGKFNHLLIFLLVMSLPGALSNPLEDAISSQYVETKHRGKYNSIRTIARILGQFFASLVVTWGVMTNQKIWLILVVSIFFLLGYLCTALIDFKPELPKENILKKTMQYIFKKKSKLKTIYSLRASQIIERIFVPLYLYLILQDFVAFSTVISLSLLIQIITVIIAGRFTDKNIKKTNHLISIVKIMITSVFLLVRNKFMVSINKTISDNFEKVYETSVQTAIQNTIKNEEEEDVILATVGQMTLCFTEVVILLILAFISLYGKQNVFYILFALSILSTIAIDKQIAR